MNRKIVVASVTQELKTNLKDGKAKFAEYMVRIFENRLRSLANDVWEVCESRNLNKMIENGISNAKDATLLVGNTALDAEDLFEKIIRHGLT